MKSLFSRVRTFDALRYHRSFRFLLTSNIAYLVCVWMLALVQSWLAYETTGSVLLIAIYGAARMAPQLFGPFLGIFVDTMNRKRVLIAVRALLVSQAGALAVLSAAGILEYWHLIVAGVLQGIVMTVSYPAMAAITLDIVGKERIVNAFSLNQGVFSITQALGPLVGGFVVSSLGATASFWLGAVLASLGIVFFIPVSIASQKASVRAGSILRDFRESLSYVMRNRDLLAVIAVTLVANLFVWSAYASFTPVFAKDNLGTDALGLGILTSGFGIGAFVGAVILASMGDLKWRGLIYIWGTLLFAVFYGIFTFLEVFPLALVLISLAGLASSGFGTMQGVLTLMLSPEEMRGRIMGFIMLGIGGMSIGSLVLGAVANIIGVTPAVAISSAVLCITTVAIVAWAPNLRRL